MDSARRTVTVEDGTTIAYALLDGVEPAVVVLHGLAGSGREFLPTARALSPRKVILVDQRGHGGSTRVPEDTSRAAFVRDVVAVAAAESVSPVDLVGQSMGAHTAMLVAAAHPDLVRRLVLLEGNEGGGSPDEHVALGDFFRSWNVPFVSRAQARQQLGQGALAEAWVADLEERDDGLYPRFDADVMQRVITDVGMPRWAEWESVTTPCVRAVAASASRISVCAVTRQTGAFALPQAT